MMKIMMNLSAPSFQLKNVRLVDMQDAHVILNDLLPLFTPPPKE